MTEKLLRSRKLLRPLRTCSWPERWLTRLLGAAVAAAAYGLCLPWDLRNRAETPGSITETTPVTGPGVAVLAVVLLALAAYFGHRDALAWPLLVVAAPPVTLMYISFRTHPETPDAAVAWPLAWALFTLVISAGVLVAASVARRFTFGAERDRAAEGWVFRAHQSEGCH
ncbi:hypothetical protein GCM10010145_24610 [Streptomyces ruber]|uniref:Uncharacterized protein n=2 Tax=Streptomyces TaxID=1883 RepID=A0A918BB70_9ACTN|nr:hypothetical protein [Streptomyces ruber]GGQ54192.1 hypothetical protein GCM10010145_24610 [Streptomyces ruber]